MKVLQSFFPIPEDFDPGPLTSWVELMQATRAICLDNVSRLHAAGMTVLAGSDVQSGVFPGASLHRELENLREVILRGVPLDRVAVVEPD